MASNPPTHQLFGGHESGIKWLSRFLGLLPAAPESPLPLLTAPVLDAFLTGAGHMLANKHPDEFKIHLEEIMNSVIDRLDEGPIGAPSAIRLKKTVGDGFSSFKAKLPSRALPELYYGASAGENAAGGHHRHKSDAGQLLGDANNAFAAAISQGPAVSNPFGGGATAPAASNPFGGGTAAPAAGNPFGGGGASAAAPSPSPFGNAATTSGPSSSSPSPFGISSGGMDTKLGTGPASAPSPFGQKFPAQNPSPFAAPVASNSQSQFTQSLGNTNMPSSNPSPFSQAGNQFGGGGGGTQPSPFGGSAAGPAPSPFSQQAGGTQASSSPFAGSSPFSQSTNVSNNAPSGFGGGSSPFGGGSSPFGAAPATSNTPFMQSSGGPAPSPFGGGGGGTGGGFNQQQRQQGGNPRGGGGKPLCKFFQQGTCKFGNQCRFSHETSGANINSNFGRRQTPW